MRRSVLGVMIALGALWLGVVAFLRGQTTLGVCFSLLAVLRIGTVWWKIRPRKEEPRIRLDLEDHGS